MTSPHQICVAATFDLPDEWIETLKSRDCGLAILRLESYVDHEIRRQTRARLRAIMAEIGGDPWHPFLAEPRKLWIEREQRLGEPTAQIVAGPGA